MLERSAARPMSHATNTQICRFLGLIIIGVQNYEFSPTQQTFLPDFLQINGDLGAFRGFQRNLEDFEDTLKLFF